MGFCQQNLRDPITGNKCILNGSQSSQYFSALLIVAPYLSEGLTISVNDKLVSPRYIDMTIEIMKEFGVNVIITIIENLL